MIIFQLSNVSLNFDFNGSLSYSIDIYIQSPFEVPKRIETFFINAAKSANESEYNIPVKSRIPDFEKFFKIKINSIRVQVIFPTQLTSIEKGEYSYCLTKNSSKY
jgi:hypothetical protein